jgi:hypothetical protein
MLEPLLPRLKREIDARIAELRPFVAEAEQLEAAKAALLAEAAAAERAARRLPRGALRELDLASRRNGVTSVPPADSAGEEATNGRAARGVNQEAILAIVEERPGVSVAEIAAVTKIAKPTVATTVSKLKRDGVLASEAGGVKLASRQPVTLARAGLDAPARKDGASDEEWEAARRDAAA